jgi:hypothetical protein
MIFIQFFIFYIFLQILPTISVYIYIYIRVYRHDTCRNDMCKCHAAVVFKQKEYARSPKSIVVQQARKRREL